MCRKQGLGAEYLFVTDMLDHRPRDAQSVKGGGSAPDLIEYQQAFGRRVAQDIGDLIHLDHKSALAACKVVRRAYPCENSVNNADISALGRHKAAELRHQYDQSRLAHIR